MVETSVIVEALVEFQLYNQFNNAVNETQRIKAIPEASSADYDLDLETTEGLMTMFDQDPEWYGIDIWQFPKDLLLYSDDIEGNVIPRSSQTASEELVSDEDEEPNTPTNFDDLFDQDCEWYGIDWLDVSPSYSSKLW